MAGNDKAIHIIGMGLGDDATLTCEGRTLLASCDMAIGAERLLGALPQDCKAKRVSAITPSAIIAALDANSAAECPCVLMSGDTGFYSGTTKLAPALEQAGYEPSIVPGLSSLQALAARLRKPWQAWNLVSAHGRAANPAVEVRDNRETFFLTGGEWTVERICSQLDEFGFGELEAVVGQDLGSKRERVVVATVRDLAAAEKSADAADETPGDAEGVATAEAPAASRPVGSNAAGAPLAVLLVTNPLPRTMRCTGLDDSEFTRGDAPMTKSEVRVVILSKLAPCDGDVVYDIGAGSGSVSVEVALAAPHGSVFAIECDDAACEVARENIRKHAAANVTLIKGLAPEALEPLPAPDAVFIGGSKGNIRAIIAGVLAKNPTCRIVASAVTLETIAKATQAMRDAKLAGLEGTTVAVSRTRQLGGYHLLTAQNPILILSGAGAGASDE